MSKKDRGRAIRQNPYLKVHTPIPSRGIDILAATRNGVTVRFNNVNGEPSAVAKALRDEVYNSMVNDPRVSQTLDPWRLTSKTPTYEYDNVWQDELYNTGYSLSEYNSMSEATRKAIFSKEQINMINHRHHLHITIFNY